MNTNRSFGLVRNLGLAVVSACLCAGLANAQVFTGKFTLPFEAQWGRATLPAGDYEFKLNSTSLPAILEVVQGTHRLAMVMPVAVDKAESSETNELIVTRSGGRATIQMLHAAQLGTDFYYHSKAAAQEVASAPVLIRRIPVVTNGK